MKFLAQARLAELATDDLVNSRKKIKERNDRIVELQRSLSINGFKRWRVEKDHPLNVFKPSWSLAYGEWFHNARKPLDADELTGVIKFLSRVYTLDKQHSQNRKSQSFYAFTQGEEINLALGVSKSDAIKDPDDPLGAHLKVPYYAEIWYYTPE